MKKRVFSAFLTLVMLFTLIPASAVTAFAAVTEVPSGYTKVDYIESEGSSHIDTEWASASAVGSYAYEIEYAASAQMQAVNKVLCGSNGSSSRAACINFRAEGHTSVAFGGITGQKSPARWTTTTDKTKVKVEVNITANTWNITKDGAAIAESPTGSITSGTPVNTYTMYVFRNNNGSGGDYDSIAKVYGLKIWQDGTLVREFVPCIEAATGTAGFYDLVNGKFHGAAGSAQIYGPEGAPKTTVKFTTPSDVDLTVSKGFAVGYAEQEVDGKTMTVMEKTSAVTEGDITTHTYTLPVGNYRFLSMSKDGADNDKYYNWDKNFIVTYADVLAGGKTIDADPGLLASAPGEIEWEQKRYNPAYFVRQFTDEVLALPESNVSAELKAKYPDVYTTPTFTNTSKARHQYTTQAELETFLETLDAANSEMYCYVMDQTDEGRNLMAAIFTLSDISGKTLAEAAEIVKANGKPTIQVSAQVHGDEQSGTEGALATIAMLCGEYGESVLDKVNVIIMPRMNPDGSKIYKYESGSNHRSVTRDHMSVTRVETRTMINMYNLFEPEVVLDQHEFRPSTQNTTGAMPDIKISETHNLNLPEELVALEAEFVDNQVAKSTEEGFRVDFYRDGVIETSPAATKEYYSLRGSIGFIHEIPGQRKGRQQWERRVMSHFLAIKNTIDFTAANAQRVNETVAKAKADIAEMGKTYDANSLITLLHTKGTTFEINRPSFNFSDGSYVNKDNKATISKFDEASVTRPRPISYLIPKDTAKMDDILEVVNVHGIEYSEIPAGTQMTVRGYTGDHWGAELTAAQSVTFANGAYMFPVAQESGIILTLLMEPDMLDGARAVTDEADRTGRPYEMHKNSFAQQNLLPIGELYRYEGAEAPAVDTPEIPSAAGIVVNADTGEVYFAKEPNLEHAMASTTKVVTGILAIENTENYDGPVETRDRTLPAIETDLADSGDSKMDLVLGEELTIYDAVRGMMFPSGNDAARLLARTIGKGSYNAFAEMMNAKAAELGCMQTCFSTASGRDSIGHYTTAADYAVLVNYAMSNPKFRAMVGEPSYVIEADPAHGVVRHELKNGNILMHGGDDLIGEPYEGATGVKGGSTGNAKRCLTFTATRTINGKEVNLVSITLGNSSKADNWGSTRTLMDYGFERAGAEPYTVEAEGNKLTVTNPATGYVMTATISAADTAYTGKAVEPAVVTTNYPDGINWYQKWDVTYTNNVEKGTATASISFGGKTASCEFEIVEPVVTLTEGMSVDALIVQAGQTYDLNGKILYVDKALTVNNGGKIKGGMLYVDKSAIVNMGDNSGWIPVWSGESGNYDIYDFYSAEIKAGKSIISTDEGTKYSFGYKLTENTSEFSPYADAVAAGDKIKFGVELTLDGDTVDYSFSQTSVDKMAGINASASSDEFFKVNLNLTGTNNDLTKVRVAPVVKVSKLGFRYVGEATGEGSGKYVARVNTQGYYTLEDAVAAAEGLDNATNIKLVGDMEFKRPVTLKLGGNVRFAVNARAKVAISGPVTFDGQSDEGVEADGLLFRVYGEGTLTLKDGVVIRDHKNIRNKADEYSFGAAARVEGTAILDLDGVTFENCSGRNRGAIYMTGSSVANIKNSTFKNNVARSQYGGAIAIYSGGTLNVENTVFTGNSAATYGGAIGIYDSDVSVTLRNNVFTDNTCAASSFGGAIGLNDNYSGELTVDGGEFVGNSVDDIGKGGGKITLEGAIKGLDEISLTPYEYVVVGETLALEETASVAVNNVMLSGSAINAGKYITEDGMRNTLPNYIVAVGDARYETLTAAIEATKNATAATVIELYGNETVTAATTVTLNPNVQIKVTADSVISGPLTIDGASKTHTAAVPVVVDGAVLTLQNGVTLQNIVSTFTEDGSYHGIIRVENSGTLTLDKASITNCKAPYGMIGGTSGATYNIKNSTVSHNVSTVGSGGAVFLSAATFNAENSTFDNNTSAARSGAIHVGNVNSKLNLTNCSFSGNKASTKGGAICVYGATPNVKLTGCTFTDNVSVNQGGAICIEGAAAVVIDGVTMSGNKASSTTANDISYMKGTLELKGAIDMDYIALNSGRTITLDAPATFAGKITVAGPKSGVVTLVGSKVSEYYSNFTHKTSTLTFDSTGTCVSK